MKVKQIDIIRFPRLCLNAWIDKQKVIYKRKSVSRRPGRLEQNRRLSFGGLSGTWEKTGWRSLPASVLSSKKKVRRWKYSCATQARSCPGSSCFPGYGEWFFHETIKQADSLPQNPVPADRLDRLPLLKIEEHKLIFQEHKRCPFV